MEEINILEFLSYYLSKWYYVIIAVLSVIILGNLYMFFIKVPMYKSSTTIILVSKDSSGNKSYSQTDLTFNQKLTSTYSEIMKSRKVLGEVIKKNDLKYSYNQLYNMISVSDVSDTELIRVTVSSSDPNEAKVIANSIIPIFSQEVQDIYDIDNVNIIDVAIADTTPYNISFVKENVMYFAIGFVLASVIIFIVFYFDTTIKSSEVLEEKYGLTLLGNVPDVGSKE